MRYLHSQGIVHRDLKLQNILLVSKEKDSDTKIGDFGLSREMVRRGGDGVAVTPRAGGAPDAIDARASR